MYRFRRWLSPALALSTALAPVPVLAAESSSCLGKLRALPRDAHVRVQRADGDPLEGKLLSVDEKGYFVWMDVYDESEGRWRRVSLAEETVYRVDHEEKAVKPVYPALGSLLLGVAGYAAGSSLAGGTGDDPSGGSGSEVLFLTVGGAALGFALGALFGPRRTRTVHIDCAY